MQQKVSLKWQYLLSYLSIALIAGAVIGLALYVNSMERLNQSINEAVAVELSTAASYLEEQTKVFQDIGGRVSRSSVFQRRSRDAGVTEQYALVDALRQFSNYTPLAEQLFLFYRDESKIWKPGSMNSFEYYATLSLVADDPGSLWEFLSTTDQMSVYAINQNLLLLAVPLYIDSSHREEPDSVFGFVIHRHTLQKQLSLYAPGLEGSIHLYFDSTPLFHANSDYLQLTFTPDARGIYRSDSLISVSSANGLFRLIMDVKMSPLYDCTRNMKKYNVIIILLSVFLLACLCYLLTVRSYHPIRMLLDRHQAHPAPSSGRSSNELAELDRLLTRSTLSETMLRQQAQELRQKQSLLTRQFFTHLLNGNLSGSLSGRAETLGIRLTGGLVQPLILSFPGKEISEDYLLSVEMLSDDRLSFFCVPYPAANECVVILNADDEKLLGNGKEILLALNDACNDQVTLRMEGEIRDSLNDLACALPFNEVQQVTEKLLKAVSAGNISDATQSCQELQHRCQDFPESQQRFISTQVILMLMNHLQISSGDEMFSLGARLISENTLAFSRTDFLEWLTLLCQRQPANQSDACSLPLRIVSYVGEHLDDCELDVNAIALELAVPAKTVRESIREMTGLSPREYFNKRRVEKAQQLLKEETLTVAEISQAVGYGSVSYFIKNFRMAVGETPNAYREKRTPSSVDGTRPPLL